MLPGVMTARYALKGVWLTLLGAVVALSLLFGAYQYTMRHGFHFLFFKHEGEIAKIERLNGEIGAMIQGEKQAAAAQQAVNDAAQAIYQDVAKRIDHEQGKATSDALAVAERFIAANRVRCPAVGSSPGAAGATAGDHGAGNGGQAGGAPQLDDPGAVDDSSDLVAVPANDVKICTRNTLQAEAARKWALELQASSGGN